MRYAMSDQTSNRNDVASWRLHIPFEDVVAVIFGLTPVYHRVLLVDGELTSGGLAALTSPAPSPGAGGS